MKKIILFFVGLVVLILSIWGYIWIYHWISSFNESKPENTQQTSQSAASDSNASSTSANNQSVASNNNASSTSANNQSVASNNTSSTSVNNQSVNTPNVSSTSEEEEEDEDDDFEVTEAENEDEEENPSNPLTHRSYFELLEEYAKTVDPNDTAIGVSSITVNVGDYNVPEETGTVSLTKPSHTFSDGTTISFAPFDLTSEEKKVFLKVLGEKTDGEYRAKIVDIRREDVNKFNGIVKLSIPFEYENEDKVFSQYLNNRVWDLVPSYNTDDGKTVILTDHFSTFGVFELIDKIEKAMGNGILKFETKPTSDEPKSNVKFCVEGFDAQFKKKFDKQLLKVNPDVKSEDLHKAMIELGLYDIWNPKADMDWKKLETIDKTTSWLDIADGALKTTEKLNKYAKDLSIKALQMDKFINLGLILPALSAGIASTKLFYVCVRGEHLREMDLEMLIDSLNVILPLVGFYPPLKTVCSVVSIGVFLASEFFASDTFKQLKTTDFDYAYRNFSENYITYKIKNKKVEFGASLKELNQERLEYNKELLRANDLYFPTVQKDFKPLKLSLETGHNIFGFLCDMEEQFQYSEVIDRLEFFLDEYTSIFWNLNKNKNSNVIPTYFKYLNYGFWDNLFNSGLKGKGSLSESCIPPAKVWMPYKLSFYDDILFAIKPAVDEYMMRPIVRLYECQKLLTKKLVSEANHYFRIYVYDSTPEKKKEYAKGQPINRSRYFTGNNKAGKYYSCTVWLSNSATGIPVLPLKYSDCEDKGSPSRSEYHSEAGFTVASYLYFGKPMYLQFRKAGKNGSGPEAKLIRSFKIKLDKDRTTMFIDINLKMEQNEESEEALQESEAEENSIDIAIVTARNKGKLIENPDEPEKLPAIYAVFESGTHASIIKNGVEIIPAYFYGHPMSGWYIQLPPGSDPHDAEKILAGLPKIAKKDEEETRAKMEKEAKRKKLEEKIEEVNRRIYADQNYKTSELKKLFEEYKKLMGSLTPELLEIERSLNASESNRISYDEHKSEYEKNMAKLNAKSGNITKNKSAQKKEAEEESFVYEPEEESLAISPDDYYSNYVETLKQVETQTSIIKNQLKEIKNKRQRRNF